MILLGTMRVTVRRQIKAFSRPLNEVYCFKLPSSKMS